MAIRGGAVCQATAQYYLGELTTVVCVCVCALVYGEKNIDCHPPS